MYRKTTLNSLNVYNNLESAVGDQSTATPANADEVVLESLHAAAPAKRIHDISNTHPVLRSAVRLLAQEGHVDDYHNDNHQDIYEVSFNIEIPGCENPLDWTDVSESAFYSAVARFDDVDVSDVSIDQTDAYAIHAFRLLDLAPPQRPTEFDLPITTPYSINHPDVACVGGASRHSMSFIFIVESRNSTKCVDALPDYTVSIELSGNHSGAHTVTLSSYS